jgi:hypothetical protein
MPPNRDTSIGRTLHSDSVAISATREEIDMVFEPSSDSEISVADETGAVSTRIILNPFTAKRLARALSRAIIRYEEEFAPIPEESTAPGSTDHRRMEGLTAAEIRMKGKAEALLALIQDLHVPHGFEYSFKVGEGLFLPHRFLVSLDKSTLGAGYREKLLAFCAGAGMAEDSMAIIGRDCTAAWMVHIGFEASEKGAMYKIYLEFPLTTVNKPTLVHRSCKWDPDREERRAVAEYVRYPLLSYEQVMERIEGVFSGGGQSGAVGLSEALLRLVMPRLTDQFHYLEVKEEGNPRYSFDVNLYSAKLTMGDIRPWLHDLGRSFAVPDGEFREFIGNAEKRRFGHLTGGIDREGRDFFTIHFGVEPR